jgi:hypothetical protein
MQFGREMRKMQLQSRMGWEQNRSIMLGGQQLKINFVERKREFLMILA